MRVRSLRVLFSQRRSHFTSLVLNTQLTSEDSLSFGLASAWGVREIRILPLVGVTAHPRNRYSNLTTNAFSYQRPQPRICQSRSFHIECPVDLIPER